MRRKEICWSFGQRRPILRAVVVFLWLTLVLPLSARAYIDANAGGLLAQLALAGLGGLGALLKILWSRRRRRSDGVGPKPPSPPAR